MKNTLAQERSAFALTKVGEIRQVDGEKFAKLVAGLPAMILMNGFGQALAFLLAKGTKDGGLKTEDKHSLAFSIIVQWLVIRGILNQGDHATAMTELSGMSQSQYLRAQEEALALLEWVKRYAEAGLYQRSEAR